MKNRIRFLRLEPIGVLPAHKLESVKFGILAPDYPYVGSFSSGKGKNGTSVRRLEPIGMEERIGAQFSKCDIRNPRPRLPHPTKFHRILKRFMQRGNQPTIPTIPTKPTRHTI